MSPDGRESVGTRSRVDYTIVPNQGWSRHDFRTSTTRQRHHQPRRSRGCW